MTRLGIRLDRAWLALVLLAAGCGTIYTEPRNLGELTQDSVILVGRIELVPPLKHGEQDLKMGTIDPFDAKGALTNRAVLYLSSDPKAKREPTFEAMNPELEKTFFVRVPKDRRYMVHGMVLMYHRVSTPNPRQVSVDSNELLIPAPIEFDIRPTDKAIYLGTWRLHRDEFNEVNKALIVDQHSAATAEFQKKFKTSAALRKALPATAAARPRSK